MGPEVYGFKPTVVVVIVVAVVAGAAAVVVGTAAGLFLSLYGRAAERAR